MAHPTPLRLLAGLLPILAAGLPGAARAQTVPPAADGAPAYALIVGSNPGGAEQITLRYAERDAERVAGLLEELGGYDADHVHLVLRPSPEDLMRSLDAVSTAIAADVARGEKPILFFYYSGHARASAINLGARELPIAELRQRLLALPTHLTIVVLDACQSGAFSRIKGAEPTADFSFNSVNRLDAAGVAVMASSSGTELSQEAEHLGSSYFTHYLLVGLRGAGDVNRDGRVSLDEAYHYAYQETLASTAKTAVGSQHVTLETDLKGKGEIPLTYPAEADAHLDLDAGLAAELLIRVEPSGAVVAELHKSAGEPADLALPTGRYQVLVRQGHKVHECKLTFDRGARIDLALGGCQPARLEDSVAKFGAPAQWVAAPGQTPPSPPGLVEEWAVELSAGLVRRIEDDYTGRLRDFGYGDTDFLVPVYELAVVRRLRDDVQLVGELAELDAGHYHRDNDTTDQDFRWRTLGLGAYLRGARPLAGGSVVLWAQAGAGVARAGTTLNDSTEADDDQSFWGYQLGAAAGINLMPWRHLGFSLRMTYRYAPVIENLIGDVHDSGGLYSSVGLRGAF